MARSKDIHIIKVRYPENKAEILELKKRMGNAYGQFIKNYILNLPIGDKEKNSLYASVVEHLLKHKN